MAGTHAAALVATTFMLVCLAAVSGQTPSCTEVERRLKALPLPRGFSFDLYIRRRLTDTRSMTISRNSLARGPIIIYTGGKSGSGGTSVFAMVDADRDGFADYSVELLRNQDTPNGIAWHATGLFIAKFETVNGKLFGVVRRCVNPDATVLARQAFNATQCVLVTNKLPAQRVHGWRYMKIGPDGWLYISIGAPYNQGRPVEYRNGNVRYSFSSIIRMTLTGSRFQDYARGIRNTLGWDWLPNNRSQMYATAASRDNFGGRNVAITDNVPDDTLVHITHRGQYFGFPWCHTQGLGSPWDRNVGRGLPVPDPDQNRNNTNFNCSGTGWTRPVQALGPHLTPLGMLFYKYEAGLSSAFPPSYNNTIFIVEHGSWNRREKIGYRIVTVRLDSTFKRAVDHSNFAGPFLDQPFTNRSTSWARPADILRLPDGALLISESSGCFVRLSYKAP